MPDTGNHQQSLDRDVLPVVINQAAVPLLAGSYLNGNPLHFVAKRPNYLRSKRIFDIAFSGLAIVTVLSWLCPLLAILVRIDSRGPAFFLQRRTGRNGKLFSCIKFRTMVHQQRCEEHPAISNDPRITRLGKFLRRSNLDELPQFLNVLIGQMSVVGPRPHMTADCIRFSFVIPSYHLRHNMRPGITGLAQIKGFHGPTPDYQSIISRFHWDAAYICQASMVYDLRIIWLTFRNHLLLRRKSQREVL